jgi:hypothetical protein
MTIPKSYGKSFFNEKATFFDGIDVTTIESGEITSETLTVGTNDISTQVVVTSTGSVGIKTDTPGSALDVQGNIRVRDTQGDATFTGGGNVAIKDNASDPYISFHENTGVRNAYIQSTDVNGFYVVQEDTLPLVLRTEQNQNIIFQTNTSVDGTGLLSTAGTKAIITGIGSVGIGTADPKAKLHVSGGNIKVDDGFGIDFSSTSDSSAGTMSSELFDDYEEGTWTPTYSSTSGTFGAITYDPTTMGFYTKIGNMAICSGSIRTDSLAYGTASGTVTIAGLPFTVNNSAAAYGSFSTIYANAFLGDFPLGGYPRINESTAQLLYRTGANTTQVGLTTSDLGTGANANYLLFTIIYRVA